MEFSIAPSNRSALDRPTRKPMVVRYSASAMRSRALTVGVERNARHVPPRCAAAAALLHFASAPERPPRLPPKCCEVVKTRLIGAGVGVAVAVGVFSGTLAQAHKREMLEANAVASAPSEQLCTG